MDTICGIGLPELLVLVLISFIAIGPQRSRELAITLGRWLRTVMKSPWWREFNQVAAALRDLPTTLVRMAELEDELKTVRSELNQASRVEWPGSRGSQRQSQTPFSSPQDPWGVLTQQPPFPDSPDQPDTSTSAGSQDDDR